MDTKKTSHLKLVHCKNDKFSNHRNYEDWPYGWPMNPPAEAQTKKKTKDRLRWEKRLSKLLDLFFK